MRCVTNKPARASDDLELSRHGAARFQRHKLYGFINIAGLAVGLACAIFILLYLRDELS